MFSTALQITFLSSLLIATAVVGQGVIGRTDTIVSGGHRIDANTAGVLSVMPKSLHDDLVLWQMFSYSDNSDANFYDLSASGNDGTQATASQQPSHQTTDGGHYSFDGVDDYVGLPSPSFSGNTAGSVMGWVLIGSSGEYLRVMAMGSDNVGSPGFWQFRTLNSTNLQIISQDEGGGTQNIMESTGSGMATGIWHHAVLTSSGSSWSLYVDGASKGLQATAGSNTGDWWGDLTFTGPSFSLGGSEYDGVFYYAEGALDDVRVYDRSLTAAEVLAIYNNTKATYGL